MRVAVSHSPQQCSMNSWLSPNAAPLLNLALGGRGAASVTPLEAGRIVETAPDADTAMMRTSVMAPCVARDPEP